MNDAFIPFAWPPPPGPPKALVRATLVKRITDDGLCEVCDQVQDGTVYLVDLQSARAVPLLNLERMQQHEKTIVDVLLADGSRRWFPLELLRIEAS